MSVERPTFSESWYRVAELKPALRSVVQTYRQHYRGRMWYVLRDPTNNQYFRLDDAGYHFIGMLNGKMTVAEVWDACNEQLEDRAPTQGEAIQLLGQLFTSNLLMAELPADATTMFERYRKRVRREITGYLMSLLFARIPLLDPEPILNRWVGVVGWIFSPIGYLLWAILVLAGLSQLTGRWEELLTAANPQLMLKTENVFLLYMCFAGIKAIHEFGHGFACKTFGKRTGTGGEVHTMGIMFLVFAPVPYVDASSAWAFRNKWHRIMVGAAGMYVELAVAAVAAFVWANTAAGTLLHDIAYNLVFVAGVSTILFNANPLLRYDGYYMLSDLLEMPNLAQRGKDYIYYLVKRYVYRVKRARSPAHSVGERWWLFNYAVFSGIYRVFVSIAIMLYLMEVLQGVFFFLGLVLAISGLMGFVIVPVFKWIKYLALSDELGRTRSIALISTGLFLAAVVTLVGLIPIPDWHRADGFLEPYEFRQIVMNADGKIVWVMPSGILMTPAGPWVSITAPIALRATGALLAPSVLWVPWEDGRNFLVEASNPELEAAQSQVKSDLLQVQAEIRKARAEGQQGLIQSLYERQGALEGRQKRLDDEIAALQLMSPVTGTWISPKIENVIGTFQRRGDVLGFVASTDKLRIRAFADQSLGGRIAEEVFEAARLEGREAVVQVRVLGRPSDYFEGVIRDRSDILPAGSEKLPTASLGYIAGGSLQVKMGDDSGRTATEKVFEVRVHPRHEEANAQALQAWEQLAADAAKAGLEPPPKPVPVELKSGQRVTVRFTLPPKPIAVQAWIAIKQLMQRRFQM